MITLTEGAKAHLNNLKAKHKVDYVRLEVKGGAVQVTNTNGHLYQTTLKRHQLKMIL